MAKQNKTKISANNTLREKEKRAFDIYTAQVSTHLYEVKRLKRKVMRFYEGLSRLWEKARVRFSYLCSLGKMLLKREVNSVERSVN